MDAPTATDEALMLRYAQGEVVAFERLYARHELPLWRYLLRACGNRATAEELMQEVWFAVAREAAKFDTKARFTAWLYTMARNRAIDAHRTRHQHTSLDEPLVADGEPLHNVLPDEQGATPDAEAERAEQGDAILRAVAELPPEQREAFVLQADAGLSVEDIAQVTGTSFETAKSRLRYARDKLKHRLREYA